MNTLTLILFLVYLVRAMYLYFKDEMSEAIYAMCWAILLLIILRI
jgi:hypothetical protein